MEYTANRYSSLAIATPVMEMRNVGGEEMEGWEDGWRGEGRAGQGREEEEGGK